MENKEKFHSPNPRAVKMAVSLPSWLSRAADALRQLADRPWTLFLLLLALNALARPCSITAHDARLYSLQVLNQAEPGAYADDIFLRYGSQDQYSLFSRVAGPLAAGLGLRMAFLLLYFVFNTLFVFALFRLIRALFDDPVIATLALVYLVTAPLTYGGGDIFMVHEQFFTPRLIGTTLTLFALERLVRRHFLQAAALFLAAGMVMHPLMAFGGVLIWVGYVACTYLPTRVFAWSVLGTAFVGAMALPYDPASLFGTLDADWHQQIRIAVGYNYPDTWSSKDWLNVAVSMALPIVACVCFYPADAERRRFFLIAALAGAAGLAVTVAASMLPFALLFQGQPYRVLWILKVMQVPLGFLLIARWSQGPIIGKLATLALVGFFCVTHYIPQELTIFAMAMPISLLLGRLGEQRDWWYAAARAFVFGAIGWMAYRWWFFVANREVIGQNFDLNELVLFDLVSPIFVIVMVSVIASRSTLPSFAPMRWAAIAVILLIPATMFAIEISPTFQRNHTRLGPDISFLREFIQSHPTPDGGLPRLYCSHGRTDLLWIDVKATSYFSILQTAGVMFNRRTAAEIDRRIDRIAKFEMAAQRRDALFLDDAKKIGMANLFRIPFDSPAPTADDLIRLCQEPGLDFVAIPEEFLGLYSAGNGRIFVYECYKVKNSSLSARVAASAAISPVARSGR